MQLKWANMFRWRRRLNAFLMPQNAEIRFSSSFFFFQLSTGFDSIRIYFPSCFVYENQFSLWRMQQMCVRRYGIGTLQDAKQ